MATIKFPNDMPSAPVISGEDKLMIAKAGTGEALQATFNQAKNYLEITGELIDPIPPGTSGSPAVIPPGPAGQKRKFEPKPGFYQGFDEVTADKRWYFYWNGSAWSLVDMGELPNTAPTDWVAQSYHTGRLVYYSGNIYEAIAPASSTDVPNEKPLIWKKKIDTGGLINTGNTSSERSIDLDFIDGGFRRIDGANNFIVSTPGYKIGRAFNVGVGEISLKISTVLADIFGIAGYDMFGNTIWRILSTDLGLPSGTQITDQVFSIPIDVKYIDFSTTNDATTSVTMISTAQRLMYMQEVDDRLNMLSDNYSVDSYEEEVFRGSYRKNGYSIYQLNNYSTPEPNFRSSTFIPVKVGDKLNYSLFGGWEWYAIVHYKYPIFPEPDNNNINVLFRYPNEEPRVHIGEVTIEEDGFVIIQDAILNSIIDPSVIHNKITPDRILLSADEILSKLNDSDSGASTSITVQDTDYPKELISIAFTTVSPLPTVKGVVINGTFTLNIDGRITNGWCDWEVQGTSSAFYPKKNWTIKMYADEARTQKLEIRLGGQLPQQELVFKSNWIDATHTRNVGANRIWKQMVESRKEIFPLREIDLSYVGKTGYEAYDTGATGHVNGFPAKLDINGAFYGIGSLNIGKKKENYNLNAANSGNMQIEDTGAQIDFGLMVLDVNYEYRVMSNQTTNEALMTRFRNMALNTQGQFNGLADAFFYDFNIVDAVLLIEFLCATDCVAKNALWTSYDSNRILYLPYDLDTTWGLMWNGSTIVDAPTANVWQANGNIPGNTVNFWAKVRVYYNTQLKNRYKELRAGIFTVENVFNHLKELETKYTQHLYKDEFDKWAIPSKNITNTSQICNWVNGRLNYLDSIYG